MAKERIFGYDALKALSAYLVVLYHVFLIDLGYVKGQYYFPTLVLIPWLFIASSVPLFFMINGALTVRRNYEAKKLIKKSAQLLFVGVFWGLMQKLFYVVRAQDISAASNVYITQYWFFFTMAALYIIQLLLRNLPVWCKYVLIVALLIFPFTTNFIWNVIVFRDPSNKIPLWGSSGALTMYSIVYLYAGDYFAHNDYKYGKLFRVVCFVLGLSLLMFDATAVSNYLHKQFDIGSRCLPTLGALFLSISLFLIIKDWKPRSQKLRQFITFLGNNSMGIYIFHILLLIVVRGLLPELKDMTLPPVIVMLIALAYTLVSAVISELFRRSPLAFLIKV